MGKEKLARLEELLNRANEAWDVFISDHLHYEQEEEEEKLKEFNTLVKEAISLLSKGE